MRKVSIEVDVNSTPSIMEPGLIFNIDGDVYLSCEVSDDEIKLFSLTTGERFGYSSLKGVKIKDVLEHYEAVLIDCKEIVIK